jgi:hypothetical protein
MKTIVKETQTMKLALVLAGLVGATSVSAAPYYVGENLHQQNSINLGFTDTMTKKDLSPTLSTGNIAAFNLNGGYSLNQKASVRAAFPFYMASKNVSGTSRNAIGNLSIGGGWTDNFQSSNKAMTYGYSLTADIYAPLSRKDEGLVLSSANPTTDFYRYYTRTTSVTPTIGAFISQDAFSAKTNVGVGYMYMGKKTVAGVNQTADGQTKASRFTYNWQLAGSWHAMPNLNANLEYNTIYLDSKTAATRAKFRHAITPSVSGNYDALLAAAYVTVPLDAPTRDRTNVAFGINAGYSF